MPRPLVVAFVTTALLALSVVPSSGTPGPDDEPDRASRARDAQVDVRRWSGSADWRSGTSQGVWVLPGPHAGVMMSTPAGTTDYTDPNTGATTSWEYATWTSPFTELDFAANELVPSWNASTPHGTWISVELRATYTDGETSPWYDLGNWATGDTSIRRTSVPDQSDGRSAVHTDTVAVEDGADVLIRGYELRLRLHRSPGSLATPRVWSIGSMASHVPERFAVEPSRGSIAWGTELDVPRRSQNIHSGNYPEYGGGGEVWCSPASTTMVMEYFGAGPSSTEMDWIEPGYTDPQVAHAARVTWDHAYQGAGNWPFNTAYAASSGKLDAFVTRLRSLDDLERLIAAGIPVVTSQSFTADELDGAGYGTAGHLFVVVGFTADGDVVVNDPAADSNDSVRRVYPREQFERVWLRTQRRLADGSVAGGSGGIAYVIRPYDVPLPDGGHGSW
ncbi:peptidase C39-like protein [Haloactinopolyspora alba]|uniref:Peptidase C39-like protein n=1 Tax=Haloactinopolyspora alba TaxID=648780 RepID=A0A2P8EBS4_9ACTN|nr:peptidase C39 family protein [Haloactinopolyspora alba]PSL06914.1 peptidase C39-like protein [Haloactinopolyspora alba]